jgi:DNA-binding Lrp family transcriptional regulator
MATAFILINAELGQESDVEKALEAFPEVKETNHVYGVYDLVVKVESESMEVLKEVLHNRIRPIEDIKSTMTLIVID